MIAWIIAGITGGLLVAVIDLSAQVVYAIGLAALVTLGGIVVYLRTKQTQWIAQLEQGKAFEAALARQSQALSELRQAIDEFQPVEFRSDAARWLLARRIHLLAEREHVAEVEHGWATQLFTRLQDEPAARQFRKELQGLLRRYEEADLPQEERVVWLQVLGLSLCETGLDEISRVEQISKLD